ncbi:hypothetical protein IL306_008328 [Fusarium sp. DS 682]|nr:hypothetical protein IL306_008328 [Fusarium sp. DS 682]
MSSQQATFMLNAILEIQNNGHLDEGELIAALLQWPLTDRHLIHSFAQVLLDACNSAIYKDNKQNSQSNLLGPLSEQDGPAKQKLRIKKSRIRTDGRDTPQITALATPGPEPEAASSMLSPSSINAPSPQKDHDEKYSAESCLLLQEPSLDLVSQSIEDFIRESQYEVSCFGSAENSERTYQLLLDLIDGDAVLGERQEEEARWTDGAEWLSLLESGRKDRKKGTICYAITTIAFARWHATQVRLVKDDTTSQQASQQVSARILNSHSDNDMPRREKQRKKLNTHLARGRKWLRLVEALGLGILFRKAWYRLLRISYRAQKLTNKQEACQVTRISSECDN